MCICNNTLWKTIQHCALYFMILMLKKCGAIKMLNDNDKNLCCIVPVTIADTIPLEEDFGFLPSTPLRDSL